MFLSTFLVNRQKILDPAEVAGHLASYFPGKRSSLPFLFRVEWAFVGVVVPGYLLTSSAPVIHADPACQITNSQVILNPVKGEEREFRLTARPEGFSAQGIEDGDIEPSDLKAWFQASLGTSAQVLSFYAGPHPVLFLGPDNFRRQQRVFTMRGKLRIDRPRFLIRKIAGGIGQVDSSLGTGFLYLPCSEV